VNARAARFYLRKYYLDCVGGDGTACIGYAATLRWGPLLVHYASLLDYPAAGGEYERHTYARVPEPVLAADGLEWHCEALGVGACWHQASPAEPATLFADDTGWIRWHAIAPRAQARIERRGRPPLEGWGYAECLELTIEPWRLPFDTLHWGRFHSANDALVWIGWDGDVRLRHILHHGEPLADATFAEQLVRFAPGTELRFAQTRTLRDAPVVAAVARLPRVLRRLPPSFMTAREVKWLSQAQLWTRNQPPTSG
jgi:hypothetical protein